MGYKTQLAAITQKAKSEFEEYKRADQESQLKINHLIELNSQSQQNHEIVELTRRLENSQKLNEHIMARFQEDARGGEIRDRELREKQEAFEERVKDVLIFAESCG